MPSARRERRKAPPPTLLRRPQRECRGRRDLSAQSSVNVSHATLSHATLSHAMLSQATLFQTRVSQVSRNQGMPPRKGFFQRSGEPKRTGYWARAKPSAGRSPLLARVELTTVCSTPPRNPPCTLLLVPVFCAAVKAA